MSRAHFAENQPAEMGLSQSRTFAGALAWLWSRILFAGQTPQPTRPTAVSVLLFLLLPALLLYPTLSFPLFEPDETRYAQIPREMLASDEWVVPLLQGEPYLDKPPLFYWLVMTSYRVFGVADWSARLVPALALHATVLLSYFLGRRSLGERAAAWGAATLALVPGFMSMGRLLVIDGLFTFCMTLLLLSAFEAVRGARLRWGWWLLAAGAGGLAVLTKGPVALLLLVPPLWAYRRLTGSASRLGWPALATFAGVVLMIASPWYVVFCLRRPEFVQHFLWEHNVLRFLSPFDRLEPVWVYGPVLLAGLFPAVLLIVPFLRFLFTGNATTSNQRPPALGFFLLASGWCVLFFSLSGSKLPTYVLPAFPPLCLAFGCFLASTPWHGSRLTQAGAILAALFLLVGQHVLVPWYAAYRSPVARVEEVTRYCGDARTPLVCFPRECNAVAFLVGRDDLRSFRSKEIDPLRAAIMSRPRTVVLCTHRHSLHALKLALPPEMHVVEEVHFGLAPIAGLPDELNRKVVALAGETALGLCDLAVVEWRMPRPDLAD